MFVSILMEFYLLMQVGTVDFLLGSSGFLIWTEHTDNVTAENDEDVQENFGSLFANACFRIASFLLL